MYQDIKSKQIVIIGQGPSSRCMNHYIDQFENKDVLWASLNRYHIFEKEVLSRINRHFDILWCSSNVRFDEMRSHLKKSGERGSLIMTTTHTSLRINFDVEIYISDLGIGISSVFAMLCALGRLGAREIYLIGFDGYAKNAGNVYFGQERMRDNFSDRRQTIKEDTDLMNKVFWDYFTKTVRRTQDDFCVFNMIGSRIICFPQIDVLAMMKQLKEEE